MQEEQRKMQNSTLHEMDNRAFIRIAKLIKYIYFVVMKL